MKIKISPSILSADFGSLNEEIREVEKHADSLHLDIMDGHFVDNISYGAVVVKGIKTKLPMDCHLMVEDPVRYAKDFSSHVDRIFFHAELFEHDPKGCEKAIRDVRAMKVDVGLALNPNKPLSLVIPYLSQIDAVLIMSVYAGFGGQKFMPDVLGKVKELRQEHNYQNDIVIDGGIDDKTIRQAYDSGANVFVSGTGIFGKKDRKKAIDDLRGKIK